MLKILITEPIGFYRSGEEYLVSAIDGTALIESGYAEPTVVEEEPEPPTFQEVFDKWAKGLTKDPIKAVLTSLGLSAEGTVPDMKDRLLKALEADQVFVDKLEDSTIVVLATKAELEIGDDDSREMIEEKLISIGGIRSTPTTPEIKV